MSKVRVGALESFDHSPFLSTGLPSLEVRIDDRRTGDWFGSICSIKESDKEGYCTGRMGMEFQAPGWCQKSQHFRGCKRVCNSPVKAIKVMIDAIENAESEGIADLFLCNGIWPMPMACFCCFFLQQAGKVRNPEFLSKVASICKKDDYLVVGCNSGGRSLLACIDLLGAGFEHVTNMEGGYSAWVDSGLAGDKPAEELKTFCKFCPGNIVISTKTARELIQRMEDYIPVHEHVTSSQSWNAEKCNADF
ncbi:hypothetical protein DKX38_019578 [Salix brachista]|uniref:Rhodanese domain-containing protein n=1 Tax=Salix brachista TaxID=2182728 RepID=A0A5N5KGQ1_9ROSI|nr:hypothetical protein DKX38_019578 [Salix brachista]